MTSAALAPSTGETRPSAVVVGAGIAGLSAAFYLAERGFQVSVYEKGKTAGGNLGATIASSRKTKASNLGEIFEVYPHMFGDWYNNFWELMEAIDRGKDANHLWRPMTEFKFLTRPKTRQQLYAPRYHSLQNNGSFQSLWSNLFSGIIPLPDMMLAGYAALGLLSEDFKDAYDINIATFNDFLNTRFYGSKYVTQFYQMLILYIWSLEPDESSVYACQRFFQFQLRQPLPTAWVLKSGNAYSDVILPLVDHLQTKLNVKFHFDTPVVAASLNSAMNRVEELMIIEKYSEERRKNHPPKTLGKNSEAMYVFALPPETLSALVQTPIPPKKGVRGLEELPTISLASNKFGIITDILFPGAVASTDESEPSPPDTKGQDDGVSVIETDVLPDESTPRPLATLPSPLSTVRPAIVDAIPELATTKTLSAEPIPVLYLAFKDGAKINDLIPEDCYVGLTDSKYALTVVAVTNEFKTSNRDFFATTPPVDKIVALAASDYSELPIFRVPTASLGRSGGGSLGDLPGAQILEDKSRDLILEEARRYLPIHWDDIAWSFFRSNENHRLFLNDVDSARHPVQTVYRRPASAEPILQNLAFAGDYCSQDVVMSTVESAVETGFRAGAVVCDCHAKHAKLPRVTQSHRLTAPRVAKPLTLQTHKSYPKSLITASKLALMPYAVLAKSWSDLNSLAENTRAATTDVGHLDADLLMETLTFWPRQASTCIGAYQDALHTLSTITADNFVTSAKIFSQFFNRR